MENSRRTQQMDREEEQLKFEILKNKILQANDMEIDRNLKMAEKEPDTETVAFVNAMRNRGFDLNISTAASSAEMTSNQNWDAR